MDAKTEKSDLQRLGQAALESIAFGFVLLIALRLTGDSGWEFGQAAFLAGAYFAFAAVRIGVARAWRGRKRSGS